MNGIMICNTRTCNTRTCNTGTVSSTRDGSHVVLAEGSN